MFYDQRGEFFEVDDEIPNEVLQLSSYHLDGSAGTPIYIPTYEAVAPEEDHFGITMNQAPFRYLAQSHILLAHEQERNVPSLSQDFITENNGYEEEEGISMSSQVQDPFNDTSVEEEDDGDVQVLPSTQPMLDQEEENEEEPHQGLSSVFAGTTLPMFDDLVGHVESEDGVFEGTSPSRRHSSNINNGRTFQDLGNSSQAENNDDDDNSNSVIEIDDEEAIMVDEFLCDDPLKIEEIVGSQINEVSQNHNMSDEEMTVEHSYDAVHGQYNPHNLYIFPNSEGRGPDFIQCRAENNVSFPNDAKMDQEHKIRNNFGENGSSNASFNENPVYDFNRDSASSSKCNRDSDESYSQFYLRRSARLMNKTSTVAKNECGTDAPRRKQKQKNVKSPREKKGAVTNVRNSKLAKDVKTQKTCKPIEPKPPRPKGNVNTFRLIMGPCIRAIVGVLELSGEKLDATQNLSSSFKRLMSVDVERAIINSIVENNIDVASKFGKYSKTTETNSNSSPSVHCYDWSQWNEKPYVFQEDSVGENTGKLIYYSSHAFGHDSLQGKGIRLVYFNGELESNGKLVQQPEILSTVGSLELKLNVEKLDLEKIGNECKNVEFRGKGRPLLLRLQKPTCSGLLLETGKLVILGTTTLEDFKKVSRNFARMVQKAGYDVRLGKSTLHYYVGCAKLPFKIDLQSMVKHNDLKELVRYDFTVFPGVVLYVKQTSVICLVFKTGTIWMKNVAKANELDFKTTLDLIYPCLRSFGVSALSLL